MAQARGTFEVRLAPQKPDNPQSEAAGLSRASLDKEFDGDLKGTSQGEMLSLLNRELGSGGYVAMERVQGTLDRKNGSFVLQHIATMTRGEPDLKIAVVPDSGTGELTGLAGTMTIKIEDKQHYYYLDYTLEV
jgi:hypothetical protein